MDAVTIGGLFGLGGSVLQGLFGQSSAQASMDFQREVLQNRNQWMVQDLKKAGLNPILAAGATSSGSASGAQAHIDNPGTAAVSSAMQAKMADIAKETMINNNRKIQSEINVNSAEAAKKWAEVNYLGPQAEANIDVMGSSADVNRQNIAESEARVEQIYSQVHRIDQEVQNLVAELKEISARTKVATTQAAKNVLEGRYYKAQEQLTRKLEEGRTIANEGLKISNTLESYNLARGKEKNDFYRTTFGKWIFRAGETIKALSPFVPSSISIPSGSKPPIGFK